MPMMTLSDRLEQAWKMNTVTYVSESFPNKKQTVVELKAECSETTKQW